MTALRNREADDKPASPILGIGKALFIVFLTVLFFLLALSMARHHFFGGGQDNHGRNSTGQKE
jgi:hypothetical protein